MEAQAQPLQPPPPLVRQGALAPAVPLLLQPRVEPWVLLLRPGGCQRVLARLPLPCCAGSHWCWRCWRWRHAAVAVLGMEGRQLAEAGSPGVIIGIHTKAQGRQLLLLRRRQLACLPGIPLGSDPCAQAWQCLVQAGGLRAVSNGIDSTACSGCRLCAATTNLWVLARAPWYAHAARGSEPAAGTARQT